MTESSKYSAKISFTHSTRSSTARLPDSRTLGVGCLLDHGKKSSLGDQRPERLRVVCNSMTAPPVVCLSGTPFEVSPLDIKWYVQAMQDAAGYVYPHDVG